MSETLIIILINAELLPRALKASKGGQKQKTSATNSSRTTEYIIFRNRIMHSNMMREVELGPNVCQRSIV
jgi:hypothetical protein